MTKIYPIVSPAISSNNVPDRLFEASSFPDSIDGNDIKKLFYDLWDIKSTRPMLSLIAHATVKGFYLRDGLNQMSEDQLSQLRIEFKNGSLGDQIDGQSFCAGKTTEDKIQISISKKDRDGHLVEFSPAVIKGTILHEFHHCCENLRFNNLMMPFNESHNYRHISEVVVPHLNGMIEEARRLETSDKDIDIYPGVLREKESFPYSAFRDFTNYKDGNGTLYKEIPVRVSESLGSMIGDDCSEERAFDIMKERGLKMCVDFFEYEMSEIKSEVKDLDRLRGIDFSNCEDLVFSPIAPKNSVSLTHSKSLIERCLEYFSLRRN